MSSYLDIGHENSRVESANVGDWLEVNGTPGNPSPRGEIVQILGEPGHVRFRVRWDEQHESIVYPRFHQAIVHHPANNGNRRS